MKLSSLALLLAFIVSARAATVAKGRMCATLCNAAPHYLTQYFVNIAPRAGGGAGCEIFKQYYSNYSSARLPPGRLPEHARTNTPKHITCRQPNSNNIWPGLVKLGQTSPNQAMCLPNLTNIGQMLIEFGGRHLEIPQEILRGLLKHFRTSALRKIIARNVLRSVVMWYPSVHGGAVARHAEVGEDDKGRKLRMKYKYFVDYMRQQRDDSPLYLFETRAETLPQGGLMLWKC